MFSCPSFAPLLCVSIFQCRHQLDLGNKHEEKHKMRSKHDQLPLNSTLCFSQSIGSLAWSNFKFPLAQWQDVFSFFSKYTLSKKKPKKQTNKKNQKPPHHLLSLVNSLFRIYIAKKFTSEIEYIFEHYAYCHSQLQGAVEIFSKEVYSFCLLLAEGAMLVLIVISEIPCFGIQTAEVLYKYQPAMIPSKKKKKKKKAKF